MTATQPMIPSDQIAAVANAVANPVESHCRLLPGALGVFVQLLLGCASLLMLYIKHKCERNQRTFSVFLKDSSKQIAGALVIHVCNIIFAWGLAWGFTGTSACHWYWIQVVTDTTLGVVVVYYLLQLSTKTFSYVSGRYDQENEYLRQTGHYILISIVMKVIMCAIQTLFRVPLLRLAHIILSPFMGGDCPPCWELLIVMIITPVVMNSFQLITIDIFLRHREKWERDEQNVHETPLVNYRNE